MNRAIALIIVLTAISAINGKPELTFLEEGESANLKDETRRIFTVTDLHELKKMNGATATPDGEYFVFEVSQWNSKDSTTTNSIMYIQSNDNSNNPTKFKFEGNSPRFAAGVSNKIFYLSTENDVDNIYYTDFPPTETSVSTKLTQSPISIDSFRLSISENKLNVVFAVRVYPQFGSDLKATVDLDKIIEKRGTNTYRLYTQLMVNHWDTWNDDKVNNLFYQRFTFDATTKAYKSQFTPVNLLAEFDPPSNSPVPPFGGDDLYSISIDGKVAFSAVSRKNEATNTKWIVYIAEVDDNSVVKCNDISSNEPNHKGRSQSPVFSADGSLLFYLAMPRDYLESDLLFLAVYNIQTNETYRAGPVDFTYSVIDFVEWDGNILFTADTDGTKELYLWKIDQKNNLTPVLITAEETPKKSKDSPLAIAEKDGKVIAYCVQQGDNTPPRISKYVFTSDSNKVLKYESNTPTFSVNPNFETDFFVPVEENFHFKKTTEKGEEVTVQGWVLYPIGFDKNAKTKYPIAYLIHGGPEGSWGNDWNVRWNPMLWASHGYFTVMINPEGSTGQGQKFVDAVRNDWGGEPFRSLVKGLDAFANDAKYKAYVDKENACAAGASYGGYMINWIQGHPSDIKFKCLVTHDGVFSTLNMFYITDEMWFPFAEYCPEDNIGCAPYDSEKAREGYLKHSPEAFVDKWSTPHLIIHGSNDLRIPVSEGISAFTALQMKNVPSKFIHYAQENHWVLKHENGIAWYDNVLTWFDTYTKPASKSN